MKVLIDLRKSLQENADSYFQKAKKAKRKLAGAEIAIADLKKRVGAADYREKETEIIKKRSRHWFEKFHWFHSSDGFLVIGGTDAKSNEIIVKRHMENGDLYFHADISGAPHVVVKAGGSAAQKQTMQEAAGFAAVFSRAWKDGLSSLDVYSVLPGQVSKKAQSGESMGTGAFMIYGERSWFRKMPLDFAAGIREENGNYVVVSGPGSAVRKNAIAFCKLAQGEAKKGETAKRLKKIFEDFLGKKSAVDLDEIVHMLPAGGFKILGAIEKGEGK